MFFLGHSVVLVVCKFVRLLHTYREYCNGVMLEATESSANSDQRTTLDAFPYGKLLLSRLLLSRCIVTERESCASSRNTARSEAAVYSGDRMRKFRSR